MDILNQLSKSKAITLPLPDPHYFQPNSFNKVYDDVFNKMLDLDSYISSIYIHENVPIKMMCDNQSTSQLVNSTSLVNSSDVVSYDYNVFFTILIVLDGTIQILPSDSISKEVTKFKKNVLNAIDDKNFMKSHNVKWQQKRIKKVKEEIFNNGSLLSLDSLFLISHFIQKAITIIDANFHLLYETNWDCYDNGFVLIDDSNKYIIFEDDNQRFEFNNEYKKTLLKK